MEKATANIIRKIIRGDIEKGILVPEALESLTEEEAATLCRDEHNGKKVLYYIYDNKNIKGPEDQNYGDDGLDTIQKTSILFELCSKYAATSPDIAAFACYVGDYKAVFQNEDFLLSKRPDEKRTYLDDAVKYFKEAVALYSVHELCLTGPILGHKLVDYDNKYFVELLFLEFGTSWPWTTLSKSCLVHKLDNGSTILEFLISKDETLVAGMFEQLELTLDDAIIIEILLSKGIKFKMLLGNKQSLILVNSLIYKDLETVEISPEEEALLTYFKELFLKDSRSDVVAVELVCRVFLEQISLKFPYAMRDLQSLINIKLKFPNFSLKIIDSREEKNKGESSSFSPQEEKIFLKLTDSTFTINHEIGHALHYYSSTNHTPDDPRFIVPDGFNEFCNLTDEQLRKIRIFFSRTKAEIEKSRAEITKKLRASSCFGKSSSSDKGEFYEKLRDALYQAVQESTYSPELMQYIYDHLLTPEEYESYFKTNIMNTLQAVMLNESFGVYYKISDIFDALSKGRLFAQQIAIDGKTIVPLSGHGVAYFSREGSEFYEIIAQYIAIIKSKKSSEGIEILTDILGKDFLDFLKSYYENLIVYEKRETRRI